MLLVLAEALAHAGRLRSCGCVWIMVALWAGYTRAETLSCGLVQVSVWGRGLLVWGQAEQNAMTLAYETVVFASLGFKMTGVKWLHARAW